MALKAKESVKTGARQHNTIISNDLPNRVVAGGPAPPPKAIKRRKAFGSVSGFGAMHTRGHRGCFDRLRDAGAEFRDLAATVLLAIGTWSTLWCI